MRLLTVRDAEGDWVAAERQGQLVDLSAAGVALTMLDLVRAGSHGLQAARAAAERSRPRRALEGADVAAPLRPGKILCSGINYKATRSRTRMRRCRPSRSSSPNCQRPSSA